MQWESILTAINFAAGVVVVAESLNKLERLDVFGLREAGGVRAWRVVLLLFTPWRWTPGTGVRFAQFAAWFACAIGGGGAVMLPFLSKSSRSTSDVLALAGFAIIILQARFMEWRRFKTKGVRYEPDSFNQ